MAIGRVEPFRIGADDWDQYTEKLEQYFIANEIPDERKVSVLITVIGPETYRLLRNLIAPERPAGKTYDELVRAIRNRPLVVAERYRFHQRNQRDSESVAQYMAELRRIADGCLFRGYLEEALMDQLVCGLRDEAIQRELLTTGGLTLAKAYETSLSMETARRQESELQASNYNNKCFISLLFMVFLYIICRYMHTINLYTMPKFFYGINATI